MGMLSFDMGCDDRDYDSWLTTLGEAFTRLDVLQIAVTELCRLCQREDVNSEQVLELLETHGAITKTVNTRFQSVLA
jgi:hypothetical protein